MDRNRIFKTVCEENNSISIFFDIENNYLLDIGDQINLLNDNAYMHGVNWGILIEYYLNQINTELTNGLKNVSGTGICVLCYERNPDNEIKANKVIGIIEALINDRTSLFKILEDGKDIQ